MKLLLHVCCGPCTIFPLSVIRQEGIKVSGYFYNPNIHPFREFKKRKESVRLMAEHFGFHITLEHSYGLVDFLRKTVFHEQERCPICYDFRLSKTAEFARDNGFDAFSTTLLYSRYQNHQALIDTGHRLAETFGLSFFYRDFREGWQEGIDISKSLDLYRQSYCGCIYSEQESFDKHLKKKLFRQKAQTQP
ncbi:MAG: epoxyqueuosine reductase QueH [Desulfocapsaceae bacterium]|nr:epoxyqueuosine reductase QueH [Desulfocapsaceae bacterium]